MNEPNRHDHPDEEPAEQRSKAEDDQSGQDDAVEQAAAEIEQDPAANPQDPVLREIKGG